MLELPMLGANFGFDPNGVVPLPGAGTVYVPFEVTAAWGSLSAPQGALVAGDFSSIRVSAPVPAKADGATLQGKDWRMTLSPGWKVVAGKRAGDVRLIRE